LPPAVGVCVAVCESRAVLCAGDVTNIHTHQFNESVAARALPCSYLPTVVANSIGKLSLSRINRTAEDLHRKFT